MNCGPVSYDSPPLRPQGWALTDPPPWLVIGALVVTPRLHPWFGLYRVVGLARARRWWSGMRVDLEPVDGRVFVQPKQVDAGHVVRALGRVAP